MRFWLLALLPLVLAFQVWALAARDDFPTPDKDPFYKPPKGWESKPLGTILRSRKIEPKGLFDLKVKEAWQILYRTSYVTEDQPTTTVTTVLVPFNAADDKLLTFGYFEDANGPQCAPSNGFRNGISDDAASLANLALLLPYLQAGYIVTVPDKEGDIGAFGSGRVEGQQTLDGIRATLKFDKLGLSKNTKVAAWGYSGGAIQIGWAASLKPVYAPELPMVGWYYGGTPASIRSLVSKLNESLFSGFLISGVTGIMDTYPELKKYIKEKSTQEALDAFDFARSHCSSDVNLRYMFQNFNSDKYSKVGGQYLKAPVVEKIMDELEMGSRSEETPTEPVMMSHGKSDEIAPFKSAYQAYENWCSNGANIHFTKYTNLLAAHLVTAITDITSSFSFIKDRLDGKPAQSYCSVTERDDIILDTDALGQEFKHVLEIIAGVLSDKVGPGDKILQDHLKNGN
ncbi:triglyceride lipase [Malassezia pachydermatis]|uniref:triacylglycerol lipase n=1 Tax=Malassezia pachydermatis TaxID=77020 RepID=A0A0M8MYL1_9BASI|nr:putative secretory lipase (family lip) [Malassezia pachydermatis]KOS16161.1 putative secretory lipase (family lip) [Malassezia pachydermatis]